MRRIRSSTGVAAGIVVGISLLVAVVSVAASTGSLSPKAILAQQHATERAAAIAAPRSSKSVRLAPLSSDYPARQQGILDIRQGPVPASEFLVVNSWQGPVSGSGSTWYVVWAGATGSISSAPGSPGIIVHLQTPTADGLGFTDALVGTFTESKADGPLAIVGVNGTTLTLATPSGRVFHFDLQANRFA